MLPLVGEQDAAFSAEYDANVILLIESLVQIASIYIFMHARTYLLDSTASLSLSLSRSFSLVPHLASSNLLFRLSRHIGWMGHLDGLAPK